MIAGHIWNNSLGEDTLYFTADSRSTQCCIAVVIFYEMDFGQWFTLPWYTTLFFENACRNLRDVQIVRLWPSLGCLMMNVLFQAITLICRLQSCGSESSEGGQSTTVTASKSLTNLITHLTIHSPTTSSTFPFFFIFFVIACIQG